MASQLMGLSLFIMMLAFFIVLNAISSFHEQKVDPVMKSVSGTFGGENDADIITVEAPVTSGNKEGEGSALEKIEALFKTNIAGIKADINEATGTMHLQVPFDEFYDLAVNNGSGNNQNEKTKQLFTVSLSSLMKARDYGLGYRVDLLVGIGQNPAKAKVESPSYMQEISRQMGKIALSLNKSGIDNSAISVGIHHGIADMIDVYFKPANYM